MLEPISYQEKVLLGTTSMREKDVYDVRAKCSPNLTGFLPIQSGAI